MIVDPQKPTADEICNNMVWIPEGEYPFRVYLRCSPERAQEVSSGLNNQERTWSEFTGIEWIDLQAPDLIVVNGKEDYYGDAGRWLEKNWPERATLLTGREAEAASGWTYKRNQTHDYPTEVSMNVPIPKYPPELGDDLPDAGEEFTPMSDPVDAALTPLQRALRGLPPPPGEEDLDDSCAAYTPGMVEGEEATTLTPSLPQPWPALSREQMVRLHEAIVKFQASMEKAYNTQDKDEDATAYLGFSAAVRLSQRLAALGL